MDKEVEFNTPFKRAVHMILHSIINLEDKYVLDKRYVRWGRVERDLWELEKLQTANVVEENEGKSKAR